MLLKPMNNPITLYKFRCKKKEDGKECGWTWSPRSVEFNGQIYLAHPLRCPRVTGSRIVKGVRVIERCGSYLIEQVSQEAKMISSQEMARIKAEIKKKNDKLHDLKLQ